MSHLQMESNTPNKPFSITGVYLTDSFLIRNSKLRNRKFIKFHEKHAPTSYGHPMGETNEH